MGIKWTVKVNKLPEMTAKTQALNGKAVEVGALNGANAWLAGIHEYGCDIQVTDKMRAYLHSQGLHLSKNTHSIHIPERSFIRNGHDANADRIMEQTGRATSEYIDGSMSLDSLLDLYGQQMSTAIKKYITDLRSPPNSSFTIQQKGSSNPLVDTGGLVGSISWQKR